MKQLAKVVHLGLGLDLLGSKTSLTCAKGNELEVTDLGVKAISGRNQRVILIPWANIKGVELMPQPVEMVKNIEDVEIKRGPGRPPTKV